MKKLIYPIAIVCFLLIFFSACSTANNTDESTTKNNTVENTVENTGENTSNVTVQKMPEIIEGTWNPLDDSVFSSEIDFDSNGDGYLENWIMDIVKIDKGFVVEIDVITRTYSYHPEDF